ncbi:hypothetical protein [Novipirellula sp.]|uniref:hypothetical protein n=1 Tax=Novipirellula sp. TaxID=2795430 RepID=UPI00356606B1
MRRLSTYIPAVGGGRYRIRRRGIVLICTLVCLIVVSTLVMTSVASAVRGQRETLRRHQSMQTEWLLDAGINRAIAQIAADDQYEGENWIPAFENSRFAKANVEISVTAASGDDDSLNLVLVDVVATLARSVDSPAMEIATRTQKSYTFQVSKSNPQSALTNDE